MLLAEYKISFDIISNLINRAPIIIALILILFIVIDIGVYIEIHKTKELLKINNELLKDLKDKS